MFSANLLKPPSPRPPCAFLAPTKKQPRELPPAILLYIQSTSGMIFVKKNVSSSKNCRRHQKDIFGGWDGDGACVFFQDSGLSFDFKSAKITSAIQKLHTITMVIDTPTYCTNWDDPEKNTSFRVLRYFRSDSSKKLGVNLRKVVPVSPSPNPASLKSK